MGKVNTILVKWT